MKRTLLMSLAMVWLAGCTSIHRLEATRDAVDKGLVEGIPPSSRFEAIPWSMPAKPLGPYSKLGGLTAYFTNAPDGGRTYVFYLGKSRQTKEWEVFASMMYRDGKWEPVPVKLPGATR